MRHGHQSGGNEVGSTRDGIVTDRELVRRARVGDGASFDALVRRYLRPALAIAWEFTESRDDAEDVVQDAFHRVLRGLDGYDDSRPFRPWFFAIVRNTGRNAAAWRGRWSSEPIADSLPSGGSTPLTEVERAEIRDRIGAGMETLSGMQRSCFRLCDLEGFATAEAAEMLGIQESTVRVHVFRARRALREVLRPLREETGSA